MTTANATGSNPAAPTALAGVTKSRRSARAARHNLPVPPAAPPDTAREGATSYRLHSNRQRCGEKGDAKPRGKQRSRERLQPPSA